MSSKGLQGRRVLDLGEARIEYDLYRSARRTLGISVSPEGQVDVRAPLETEEERIETVLRRKRAWIERQLREVADLSPPAPARSWTNGATHVYLGRQYRIRIHPDCAAGVRLVGAYFEIDATTGSEPDAVRRAMERWFRRNGRPTIQRRLDRIVASTPRLGLDEAPELIVRKVRTRWGSCSKDGRILINAEAIRLPVGCIDYLLVHELCHLRFPRHDRAFWLHVSRCMPDWRRWKRRLEEFDE